MIRTNPMKAKSFNQHTIKKTIFPLYIIRWKKEGGLERYSCREEKPFLSYLNGLCDVDWVQFTVWEDEIQKNESVMYTAKEKKEYINTAKAFCEAIRKERKGKL